MLRHQLPPRKRLAAQMKELQQQHPTQRSETQPAATAVILTGARRPREKFENIGKSTLMTSSTTTKKARVAGGGRMVHAMIPESDVIREARARAVLAGGELAVSAAAAEAKATARAKGARAVAAREAAIAKAHAAKAAEELAALAAKAKQKAEELERERNAKKRRGANAETMEGSTENQAKPETEVRVNPPSPPPVKILSNNVPHMPSSVKAESESHPLTDEDVARQLHAQINASPRLGRTPRGERRHQTDAVPTAVSADYPGSAEGRGPTNGEVVRRQAEPSA